MIKRPMLEPLTLSQVRFSIWCWDGSTMAEVVLGISIVTGMKKTHQNCFSQNTYLTYLLYSVSCLIFLSFEVGYDRFRKGP